MATLLVSSLVAIFSAPPVVPEKDPPERPTSEELFEADLMAVESYTFEPKEVLTLPQVLKAVDLDHPLTGAARRKIDEAQGKQTAAEGAYDFKVKAKQKWVPFGKYEYSTTEAMVEQPTTLWGTTFFGGWRRSGGYVPAYAAELETVDAGEVLAGVKIPLWQGGAIDRPRADLRQSEMGVRIARLSQRKTQLKLYEGAANAYWTWVLSGHVLRIREHLLEVAQRRQEQLKDRVERGDLPPIDLVDNQRAILKRESGRVKAARKLQKSALKLSLYLRDDEGKPRLPEIGRLPPRVPLPPQLSAVAVGSDTEAAHQNRPEPAQIALAREQLEVEASFADNLGAPQIDLSVTGIEPLQEYDGWKSELETALTFTMPIQRRKAEGKEAAALAALSQLEAEARYLSEQISVEVVDARSALDAASQQVEVARQELKASRQVEEAEQTRLALGDSTLLVVNLREQATADAAERFVEALVAQHIAHARWRLAQGLTLTKEGASAP